MLQLCKLSISISIKPYLEEKFEHLKKKKSKILEDIYNPMETAITIFDIKIEEDKLNREKQFEIFEIAWLDVKKKYAHLIDGETIKQFNNLDRANKDLNYLYNDENFENFVALTKVFRAHLGNKIREINKKSLLRFFII